MAQDAGLPGASTSSRLGPGSLVLSGVVALSFFLLTLIVRWLLREVLHVEPGAGLFTLNTAVKAAYVGVIYLTSLCCVISIIVGAVALSRSAVRRWFAVAGIGVAGAVLAYLIFCSPLSILAPPAGI